MTTFKDAEDGYRAVIEKHYSGEMIRIYVSDGEEEGIACHLDPADAPAIALAVLEAAGHEEVLNPNGALESAVESLAVHIRVTEATAAAAAEEAARGKRRDELAFEITGRRDFHFGGWTSELRTAIDRIIDAELELAKERAK